MSINIPGTSIWKNLLSVLQKGAEEIHDLEDNLEQLKGELAKLEESRNAAIDESDYKTVENLTRQIKELHIQIETKEAIIKRKEEKAKEKQSSEEFASAWAKDCAVYQEKIDKAEEELNNLLLESAEKTLEIANLVNAGFDARKEALDAVFDGEPEEENEASQIAACPSTYSKYMKLDYLKFDSIKAKHPEAAAIFEKAAYRINIHGANKMYRT